MFAKVAINIASESLFTYSIPSDLEEHITIGVPVLVPFRKRKLTGHVVEVISSNDFENTKDIIDILDHEPLFSEKELPFFRWVSDYYMYPLGKTISEALPSGLDLKSVTWIYPNDNKDESLLSDLAPLQRGILEALHDFPDGISIKNLKIFFKNKSINKDLNKLLVMGLISLEDKIKKPKVARKKETFVSLNNSTNINQVKLTKRQKELIQFLRSHGTSGLSELRRSFKNPSSVLAALEKKEFVVLESREVYRSHEQIEPIGKNRKDLILNEDQVNALKEIVSCIKSSSFSACLLHGVTGSGKTEVYLKAIEETLRLKGGVIYLVPEIALTTQLLTRVNERFQNVSIAVMHSGISNAARYDQWRKIIKGEINIVVGARSAIFAPARNLKLIIVDEEHDPSYKQDERLRYNARDLAVMKAKLHSATIVLGSATPALQTYFNAMKGKYRYLVLPRRTDKRQMPVIKVIDMKKKEDKTGFFLSPPLEHAITETLRKKEQALIFLNRRGFHTFTYCLDCGYGFKCRNCAVSLRHHLGEQILKCHYCNFSTSVPKICPVCRKKRVRSYGLGTEQLEEEIRNMFPGARISRMDSDTTSVKGAYMKILQSLDKREVDILVGTQMITKGHDFPNVTLVGIISADASLNIPDFRASERTFQLLTQAAGRSGRGDSPGRVIIQTLNPNHHAIVRAKDHDYLGFYSDEITFRQALSYPPFTRMVNLQISSSNKERGIKGVELLKNIAMDIAKLDTKGSDTTIIGPAEAPIAKIKGRYRWHLIIKGKNNNAIRLLVKSLLSKLTVKGLEIKIDVDPFNFM